MDTETSLGRIPSGLYWSVKQSFVTYLQSMADGNCSISGGADVDSSGVFLFPTANPVGLSQDAWTLEFEGTVRFSGHFGALAIAVERPVIRMTPSGGILSISTGTPDDRQIHVATLPPAMPTRVGEMLLWARLKPSLTGEGSELFGRAYPPGMELDALTIAIDAPGSGTAE